MIADRIKELRQQAGWTQAELARKLNITRSSVNAWEMGISIPSTQVIVELSALFCVPTDYLLGVSEKPSANLDDLTEEQTKIILSLLRYFNSINGKNG